MSDLDKLYDEQYPAVYAYLLNLCKNPDVAEEFAQETMYRAIMQIDSFRGDSKLSTWICTIAKNLYFAEEKKNRRISSEYPLDSLPSEKNIEQELLGKETARQIHTILHGLDEPYKEVFWMRTFGELSFKQIGAIFDKTESWARVTYHRAKMKIKEALR